MEKKLIITEIDGDIEFYQVGFSNFELIGLFRVFEQKLILHEQYQLTDVDDDGELEKRFEK